MSEHYLRIARKALNEARDEVSELKKQIVRHRRCRAETTLLEWELKQAHQRRRDAQARVRVQERRAA